MIKVAVVGRIGYTGVEPFRLLAVVVPPVIGTLAKETPMRDMNIRCSFEGRAGLDHSGLMS